MRFLKMDSSLKRIYEVTLFLHVTMIAFNSSYANDHVVCYSNVGCFTNDASCGSAVEDAFPPDHPITIGTRFLLYTPENIMIPRPIEYDLTSETLTDMHFNQSRPTKIIVHGWQVISKSKKKAKHPRQTSRDRFTGLDAWMLDMKDAFLQEGPFNIILVDWVGGSSNPLYIKSVLNTKVVGREIGLLLEHLNHEMAVSMRDVHVIGMGLGAHVAGYTGEYLKGQISRITGLDPAGLLYQDTPTACRLDNTDAIYVDVIHTDINGRGINQNIGHIDFYPNGGHNQPACPPRDLLQCSHKMAPIYFTLSITNNCPFNSFQCVTNYGRTLGVCDPHVGCPTMGAYSYQKFAHGQLCVVVHYAQPYCDRLVEYEVARSNFESVVFEKTEREELEGEDLIPTTLVKDQVHEGSGGNTENSFFLRNDLDNTRYKRRGTMQKLLVKLSPAKSVRSRLLENGL